MRSVLLGAGLALVLVGSAAAASEAPQDYVGKWVLAGPEMDSADCALELKGDKTADGFALTLAEACADLLPSGAAPVAWRPAADGAIALVEAGEAEPRLNFDPLTSDSWVYQPDGPHSLLLVRATD